MKEYAVIGASINAGDKLTFKDGVWKASGEFELNQKTTGKFELKFINNYKKEFFVDGYLSSHKYVKTMTFIKLKEQFYEQILNFVLPSLEEQIREIRKKENNIEKPEVQLFELIENKEDNRLELPFIIGDELKKVLWIKKEDGKWTYDVSFHDFHTHSLKFSGWLPYVWELAKESDQMKLPMLFEEF